MKQLISIVKYSKAGNIGSLSNVVKKYTKDKYRLLITDKANDLKASSIIILPGVGNFLEIIDDLNKKKLLSEIIKHSYKDKYILGICIGMQLLFEFSEEGNCEGMGILKGNVKKIKKSDRVPVIGWKNNYYYKNNNSLNFNSNYFYFLHSYELQNIDKNIKVMYYLNNNHKTVSIIKSKNIIATQFHPELSAQSGLDFFNFFFNRFIK